MICLLAGLRYLLASRAVIPIRRPFLAGLLFVFCSAMLIRCDGLIVFRLTTAFFCDCDCDLSAILHSLLAPFAKLFASFIFLLMVAVARHRLPLVRSNFVLNTVLLLNFVLKM